MCIRDSFKEVQAAYDAITKGETGPQMGGGYGGAYGQLSRSHMINGINDCLLYTSDIPVLGNVGVAGIDQVLDDVQDLLDAVSYTHLSDPKIITASCPVCGGNLQPDDIWLKKGNSGW